MKKSYIFAIIIIVMAIVNLLIKKPISSTQMLTIIITLGLFNIITILEKKI